VSTVFVVLDKSERDQDKERGGATTALSGLLPGTAQVCTLHSMQMGVELMHVTSNRRSLLSLSQCHFVQMDVHRDRKKTATLNMSK